MRLLTSFASALLLAACSQTEAEFNPPPDFCALTEPRRFTQAEFDVRATNWPANLRQDIAQNETRQELCP